MPMTVSDFVSDYLLAPDIVPVSGGNSREYSLVGPLSDASEYMLWLGRVAEMQAFVFELISRLKFEATEKTALIRRENCLVTLPMVGDEEQKGNQLPLRISIIDGE